MSVQCKRKFQRSQKYRNSYHQETSEMDHTEGGIDANDILEACNLQPSPSQTHDSHVESSKPTLQETKKDDPMQKWRREVQAAVEAKKKKEAEALQAATQKAQQELEAWRRERKAKIESKSQDKGHDDNTDNNKGDQQFSWKKTAELLSKMGYTQNDQSGQKSQKMADLIFMKAKE
ncbi:uncharacterized protein BXIN_0374 [Babesia sp. Xinjiang]|uniref:uncharacterized protein n=1 Tax=Babesia sp. Xinjiang TaxID=462227 RepID=UPI000A242EA0|nr:uncharacterized protein BXIN_0374 [Babesia sp. Xinjiang]ORM41172.1 hypothetical protein BXIN_0374 [Babesia sp. Xinjiang]